LFDILKQHPLDMGDYDIVYGPDEESDDELDEDASWMTKGADLGVAPQERLLACSRPTTDADKAF
jgi:hypothetical protein